MEKNETMEENVLRKSETKRGRRPSTKNELGQVRRKTTRRETKSRKRIAEMQELN